MLPWTHSPRNEQELIECLKNKMWRLHNLYKIVDPYNKEVQFKPNDTQLNFLQNRHGFDIILKARQLGLSTIVQIDMLDDCLFTPNLSAGVIAHTKDDAKRLLATKFKYPYDHMHESIKSRIPAVIDSKETLGFSNGSVIYVGTSLRSSTIGYLHISEHAKICAKHPDKAREIRTGAINAVHVGQKIVIESTAEGMAGDFYDLCQEAEKKHVAEKELTDLDFKFHFFPWWKDMKYQIPANNIFIPDDKVQYFDKLECDQNIILTPNQKAWYTKKAEVQRDEMKREFPSTSKEAFEQSIEGAYFANEMLYLRKNKRIGRVPYDPMLPVNTFWDLGSRDYTAIWLHQRYGIENRFIGYYENSGHHIKHYIKYLHDLDCLFGEHYLPHDSKNHKGISAEKTEYEYAKQMLQGRVMPAVPRVPRKQLAIQAARMALYTCYIDEEQCHKGIVHLDNYKKQFNDRLGVYSDEPLDNEATHAADAFMTFAMGYSPEMSNSRYAFSEVSPFEEYGNGFTNETRDTTTGY